MLGPYEPNEIYCGECAEMMSHLPDDCIDLTITSPPYDNLRPYNGYKFCFHEIAQQLARVTKPGGVIVWVVGDATVDGSETGVSFRQALYFMEIGLRLHDTMIYQKIGNGAPMTKPYIRYSPAFEYMFVFSNGTPNTFNPIMIYDRNSGVKKRTKRQVNGTILKGTYAVGTGCPKQNIWRIKPDQSTSGTDSFGRLHQASFPESLARDHIISWSNPGDLVLDPFVGSGTVPKMCIITDRNYLGFDISQEYIDLSMRRINETKKKPMLFSWDAAQSSCGTTDNNKPNYQQRSLLQQSRIHETE